MTGSGITAGTNGVAICIGGAWNTGGEGMTSFMLIGSWAWGIGNVDCRCGIFRDGSGRSVVVRSVEGVEERLDKELEGAEDDGSDGTTPAYAGVGGIGTCAGEMPAIIG